ncbi:hypothetical protein R1sor_011986 [Riccia sorocarpa]|uniref:Protein SSUH2 homolog n=1 Tax=Riccia sorocarpa TaxID=122646 RepID=A0ABD3I6C0_9MARC
MTSEETKPLLTAKKYSREEPLYPVPDGNVDEWTRKQLKQWEQLSKSIAPPASDGPVTVSGTEIRHEAVNDPYPQWIYAALVTPENEADVRVAAQEDAQREPPKADYLLPRELHVVQGLEEEEIRTLLCEYVDGHCCWNKTPASKWPVKKVEDCNVYIGSLETFIEERSILEEVEPYSGGPYAGQEGGRNFGPWEVDMNDEFPPLFTVEKTAKRKLPLSQRVEDCRNCSGRGEVLCELCHDGAQPGEFRPGKTTPCSVCRGRGLIAHQDGSDTECHRCQGRGNLLCFHCSSRGLVRCEICKGSGALLYNQTLIVRWSTLVNKKISAPSCAKSIPDIVFRRTESIQLYCDQAHTCKPVQFTNSYGISKLSAGLFKTNPPIPPTARIICQRHQLRMYPVTRAVLSNGTESFDFCIVGIEKLVYLPHYPKGGACSGICHCLEICVIC